MSKKFHVFRIVLHLILILGLVPSLALLSTPQQTRAQSSQPPWLDESWLYRKEIATDPALVLGDLTDFPVLVSLAVDADLAAKAQDDGDDILFTDESGAVLSHEIELFDGDTGRLLAWVKTPSLSSSASTYLYMYYGNAAASSQQDPNGVWDANFVMVQHLDETSGTHFDSTAYANDGTPQNGLIQDAVGKIGGADDFPGVNQFIDVGTDTSMDIYGPNQDFSIFLWVKRDVIDEVQGFFSSGSSATYGIYFGSLYNNFDDLRFLSISNSVDVQSSNSPLADTDWHYVGLTADRDGSMNLWVDGASVHSASISASAGGNWNRLDDTYKIGTDRSEGSPMDGILDEVRVSSQVRSPDWIGTEYHNMNDPAAFIDVGVEQGIGAPLVTAEQPADGSIGVGATLSELRFEIQDADSATVDYSVASTPDIGSQAESGVAPGTFTVPISGLAYDTTYTWSVSVTDGEHPISRDFTFSTEIDTPIVSNEEPLDAALNVPFNPTLQADIFDAQGEAVEWEIGIYLNDAWQTLDSGTLPGGVGTVSATTSGIDVYNTTYNWQVRVRESGDPTWIESPFSFTTIRNEMSFAAFTDTHIGARTSYSWGMADYLDDIADDLMDTTAPIDFVVHLGDIIMHSTAFVQGEGLPAQYDQYLNNLQAYLLDHTNVPFMAVSGNHDMNDYYGYANSSFPQNQNDPFNSVRELIDATEMNSYPYAFMKNNILFIALPETDYHMYTKPTIYAYVEYMTQRYPNNTTIIFSHQAIEDTTVHDGSLTETYRGKQDQEYWAELFRNNSQIKMWIHGHQHMTDWYQSDHSSGLTYDVLDFGHEMVFSHPYSQADWGDYHEEDRSVLYTINADGISTRTWENNGAGGSYVPDYDHTFSIPTTFDENAQDWYSFPIFLQDGEIQVTDMKAVSPNMSVELVGTQPMELFYDSHMATRGTSWGGENILGFGDDLYAEATPNQPGMTVSGPADLDFPAKYPGPLFQGGSGAWWEDGRTGQPYHFFPVGTTHAAVPNAAYQVSITARSLSGTGQIDVEMSVSDWGTQNQYSTLAGSTQQVISHAFGTEYETVTGVYTVPDNPNAWFLQGYLDFPDGTEYEVSEFSIQRVKESDTTDDFTLYLNGVPYAHNGTLLPNEWAAFPVDPVTLADSSGEINITASIAGHHFGMANLIYQAPMLFGRNANFQVNSITDNVIDLTLQQDLSYNSDTFKMFPLSPKYGGILVSSDDGSAVTQSSANGNEWIESNTPTDTEKVTLTIEYGEGAPTITDEQPDNYATEAALNPALQAEIRDLQGDAVVWEIRTDASGSWTTIASGTLPNGEGTVSTVPSNMDQYDTTYNWSVWATDPAGSGEQVEAFYQFTTRQANYSPVISNPSPPDGAVNIQPNPQLSINVSDSDGDSLEITFRTNATGSWETIATYTGGSDGIYTATPSTMSEYLTTYQWRVEVDDGTGPVSADYTFNTLPAPGSWWDPAWQYRKIITIDSALVAEDLSHFPVLVEITDPDLATYAVPNGDDIVFTDYNSLQLSHEVVLYDSATGRLVAWVNVPDLSSTANTVLQMYFGNTGAANQEDVSGTWDHGYVLVQHLDETSGTHLDSTGYANDSSEVAVTLQDAVGQVAGADELNGTADFVRVPNDASLQFGEGSFTAEAWIYPQAIADLGGARIVNTRGTGAGGGFAGYQLKIKNGTGGWIFGDASIDDDSGRYMAYDGTTTYAYNQWYHVAMVYEADQELRFYVNGILDGTLPVGDYGSLTNTLPTAIGASLADQGVVDADNRQFFDGLLDEVKLASTPFSVGWILTGYRNQSDPATFYSLGSLELSSGPPQISHPQPEDGAENVGVGLAQLAFDLSDPDGDSMDYTITTTPDIGSESVNGVSDGTYSLDVSGLAYDTTYTWEIAASDGMDTTIESYTFTTEAAPGPWYSSDWLYRQEILIDHTRVTGELLNFPLLIQVDDGSLLGLAQDDGDDILFTDYDGTQLDHEVESYDPATGMLVAWVNVPVLSASEDTVLYLYYGNLTAGNQQNPTAVWDSSYVLVQHLQETSGMHFDSTIYANDGTPYDLAGQGVPGKIGGADDFDRSGDLIDVGTDASMDIYGANQDFNLSLWVKRNNILEVHGFFSSGGTPTGGIFFGTSYQNEDELRFFSPITGFSIETASDAVSDTEWHFVVLNADRDGNMQFWVDGVLVHSASIAAHAGENWNRVDDTYKIGTDRSETNPMDGLLDEVRVYRGLLSPEWIQTSFANQENPDSFYARSLELYPDPVALADSGETDEDAPVTIDVLANDLSLDADPLHVSAVSQPAHGAVVNNGSDVTYTPVTDYCGPDSFDYQVSDSQGGHDSASVSVTVNCLNDNPTAVDDSTTTDEDTAVTIDVLDNDSDVDSDPLVIDQATQPDHGQSEILADEVRYTPDADYCGPDSFSYTVADGQGGFDTADVEVTVNCINDAPQADDDSYETAEDTLLSLLAPGVLGNDSDVDGDDLTVSLTVDVEHGTLNLNADGSFSYQPTADYHGPDSFHYSLTDGLLTDTAAVTIEVLPANDPPLVDAGEDRQVHEGETLQFSGSYTDPALLAHRPLVPDLIFHWDFGDGTSTTGTLFPLHTYADEGQYTVMLTVTDDLGAVGADTLLVTVSNSEPVFELAPAGTDLQVNMHAELVLAIAFNDPGWLDAHTLQIDWGDGTETTLDLPAGVLSANPGHVYDQAGTYTAVVTLNDEDGGQAVRTYTVTVEPGFSIYMPGVQAP